MQIPDIRPFHDYPVVKPIAVQRAEAIVRAAQRAEIIAREERERRNKAIRKALTPSIISAKHKITQPERIGLQKRMEELEEKHGDWGLKDWYP